MRAVTGLEFSAALPAELALDTIAARLGDDAAAEQVLSVPVIFGG